jgi:large exoprotein involved in heme utilization and adhesion
LLVRDGASVSVATDSNEENAGAGGDLTIETGQLAVRGGGQITAATAGVGVGGTLTVNASESVEVDGIFTDRRLRSSLETSSGYGAPNGTGKAGSLSIHTRKLSITSGAVVSTPALGQGQGGDLDVIASDSVEVAGRLPNGRPSSLAADTQGMGTAGNLRIQTRQLLVRDRGTVSAETFGVGKGGDLNITSGLLDVQNSGTITVGSTSTNSTAKGAGRLEVTAQTIRLHNQAAITANTASGQGGNIILRAQNLLLLRDNSVISTTAGGSGNGGNIKIDTDILAALEDSDITANAFTGTGGNIQITVQGLFLSPDSQITASSERGIDGVVEINAPDINPSQGLVALPAQLVDTSGLIAQTCPASRGQGQSEFIVTGRGGLPDNPSEMLNGDAIEVNLATLNPKAENRSSPTVSTNPTAPAPVPIVEAQGWVTGKNGEVILTAFAPTVTPQSPGLTPESCIVPRAERR